MKSAHAKRVARLTLPTCLQETGSIMASLQLFTVELNIKISGVGHMRYSIH